MSQANSAPGHILGTPSWGPPYWQDGDFEEHNGFPRYPAAEMKRRHAFLSETMASHDLDAILVGGPTGPLETSVQFFSNWPAQVQSYVVFPKDDAPTLSVRLWNHLPDAERISVIESVRYGGDSQAEQADWVAEQIVSAGRVGLIGVIPHGDLMRFSASSATFVDLNPVYQSFRLVKSDIEMDFVRIASRMNDAAIDALARSLRPGLFEHQVAEIIESVYIGHRAWNLIHFSLSTSMEDPQACVPHQYHPNRRIEAGDVFVTEISTTFWGYAGQILRTFTIGGPPNPRYARLHEVALETYEAIVDVLKPGTTVGEILDETERITDAGFDIWDDLCHGFGGAYLPPIVRTRASRGSTHGDTFAYPADALVVVQPNVTDGDAGVQVGNSLRLSEFGTDVTQSYPTELIVCS